MAPLTVCFQIRKEEGGFVEVFADLNCGVVQHWFFYYIVQPLSDIISLASLSYNIRFTLHES